MVLFDIKTGQFKRTLINVIMLERIADKTVNCLFSFSAIVDSALMAFGVRYVTCITTGGCDGNVNNVVFQTCYISD